ncbi:MAG TPA: hypothetical protein VJR23_00145 [Candidatus Acidoferrales bacterium]|nr:hypothetical protein [Candidatus Acidoferrales bacterium]
MTAALILTLLVFLGEMGQGAISQQVGVNQQVKDALQQALGKAPLDANSKWWGEPVRECYAGIRKFNGDYTQQMAALDKHELRHLYTTESYSTRADMQETVKELQSIENLDSKYASLDPVLDKLRQQIWAADVPEKQKDEFLTGFNKSINNSLAPRDDSFVKARQWILDSTNLYEFMLANEGGYTIHSRKLLFQSGTALAQFRDKQSRAIASYQALQDSRKNANTFRNETLKKYGLSTSDFSQNPNPPVPLSQSK